MWGGGGGGGGGKVVSLALMRRTFTSMQKGTLATKKTSRKY